MSELQCVCACVRERERDREKEREKERESERAIVRERETTVGHAPRSAHEGVPVDTRWSIVSSACAHTAKPLVRI